MKKKQGGPLQRTGVHMTKDDGEALKKTNDSAKALLDSIGSSTSSSTKAAEKTARTYSSPRFR